MKFFSDSITLTSFLSRRSMTVKMYKSDESLSSLSEYKVLVIMNLENERSLISFKSASNLHMFNDRLIWLIFGYDLETSLNLLKNQNININSKILLVIPLVIPKKEHASYVIYHIQAPALERNSIMHVNQVGSYSKQTGLIFEDPFKAVNFSMEQTILKVATTVSPLHFNLKQIDKYFQYLDPKSP